MGRGVVRHGSHSCGCSDLCAYVGGAGPGAAGGMGGWRA